jgi:RHS repeat-associated protein
MDTDGYQFENPIDDLTYLYDDINKNQLLRVFDATANPSGFKDDTDGTNIDIDVSEAPDYTYDLNGNMIKDTNKGIENIVYNHLNLPIEIVFPTGKINYLYNAIGQKVKKTVTEGTIITTTDYLSGFQYKNAVLQFFPHAEGYVNATELVSLGGGTSYKFHYVFNYTDHLGNIRLSYSKDPVTNALKIIEENHYYPFGLKHSGYNSDKMMYVKEAMNLKIKPVPPLLKTAYNYRYNSKEWQDELSLNVYDLGARLYDPAVARFMVQDPMADFINYQSPYVASDDNPVLYRDEYGLGIFNVIGNLFRRAKNGVKKLFSGNNCDCGGREESISDSWRREDFPAINEALSNLFSGNGRRNSGNNSNSTATEKPFRGDMVTAIDIQPIENATPNFNLPEIRTYVYDTNKPEVKKPRKPKFRGSPVEANSTLNLNITFQRSRYLVEPTDSNLKIINDLVKTLKEYPEIKIVISGNMWSRDPDNAVVNTMEGETSVVNFKSERAKAILKILQGKGIPASRIQTKPGNSKSMSIDVQFKY